MSLITCPKCGKTFSSYSKYCPKCYLSTEDAISFNRKSSEVDVRVNKKEDSSNEISGILIILTIVIAVAIIGKMANSVFLQKTKNKAETIEWKMSGFYVMEDKRIPATILFKQKERQIIDGSFCKGNRLEYIDMTGKKNKRSIELQNNRIKIRLQLNGSKNAGKGFLYVNNKMHPIYLRVVYRINSRREEYSKE